MVRPLPPITAMFLLAAMPLVAQGQPALSHGIPGAIKPGQTTEITLHGSKLDGALNLWTSIAGKWELVPIEADKKDVASRVCKVTIDANTPVGLGGIVVGNAAGSSDAMFFMVDDLPSFSDEAKNHAPEQAQVIALPGAVDGVCDGTAFDYYKVAGKKDQRLSVEVVAARMGSPLDAIIRLLDSSGRELLLADDDASFGADPRFAFTLPADGDYLIEIRDNQFRSGGRYRLRMGDFPLVSAPYPLGGRNGSTTRFKFTGPMADTAAPVFLRLPDASPLGEIAIAARFPEGKSSGMAKIVTSRLPDIVESEPNNDLATATLASLPCAVNGTFRERGDRDFYEFAATKGQAMQFRAVSRSMGSPSYLLMRLYNAAGESVAETAINDADETSLSYTFPADGMYRLMVEDLLGRGGPEFGYRVEAEPSAGFSLTMKHDANAKTKFLLARNGGAFAITVQVARRGYDGPIQLSLSDAPAGYVLHQPVVAAKAKEHRVLVGVPADATAGVLQALRVVGTATIDGREYRTLAQTTPTLRAKSPQMSFPPGWLDGLLTVAIGADAPPLFELASSANPIVFSRAQAQSQFTVKLDRKIADFKDAAPLFFEGLPAGFTATVKQDKDTSNVTLAGPKNAANGKHQIGVLAYGELKGAGRLVRLDVPLEITE